MHCTQVFLWFTKTLYASYKIYTYASLKYAKNYMFACYAKACFKISSRFSTTYSFQQGSLCPRPPIKTAYGHTRYIAI